MNAFTPAQLAEQFRPIIGPDQIIELRALDVRRGNGSPHIEAGYFDATHLEEMFKIALNITNNAKGCYFTLNTVKPDLLARCRYRIEWVKGATLTKDTDIIDRRWLLVDADPVKDSHISATAEEKEGAREIALKVRDFLRSRGWPEPILIDSGNGFHLLYRIDLPSDDGGLVERILMVLAHRFDNERATIDKGVFNPSRICKLPGTMARKGDHTETRPHRRAMFLEIPDNIAIVPQHLLEELALLNQQDPDASESQVSPICPSGYSQNRPRLVVERWLTDRGREYRIKPELNKGRTVYVLKYCPFDSSHADPDSCIMQGPEGMSAHCFHNSCTGRGWQEFKNEIGEPEPGHYDPPLDHLRRTNFTSSNGEPNTCQHGRSEVAETTTAPSESVPPAHAIFSNYMTQTIMDNETEKETQIKIGLSAEQIRQDLCKLSNDWPCRVGNALFVRDGDRGPLWIKRPAELFAWIQKIMPADCINRIQWADRGTSLLSKGEYDAYLRQNALRYEAVESAPHEPQFPGHYYIHPAIQGGDGKALKGFLDRFTPATEEDRDLIQAFLMTLLWGGPYGQRPAFLFTGIEGDSEMGRGIGKSTLPQMAGRLFGGTFNITQDEKWDDVIKRLLSDTQCSTQRLILVDNVKTWKFSWANLEALITSTEINGRKLYVGDGRRPNTFTVAITVNGASLSKDLAQRCVIVHLERPDHTGNWQSDTEAFIDANRWAIIGDLLAALRTTPAHLPCFGRWGQWDRDVIGRLHEPERLQDLIQTRRAAVDDDLEEADLIREAIIKVFERRGFYDPDRAGYKIPASSMAQIVSKALGEKMSVTACGRKLQTLSGAIPELSKGKVEGNIRWKWKGKGYQGQLQEFELKEGEL